MVAATSPAPLDNQTTSCSGRDAKGRFAKGNRGGPGNPFARQVAELRSAFLTRVTGIDMAAIADAVLVKARQGDVAAAKLLFQYVLGRPLDGLNPDRLDQDEWEVWQQEASRCAEVERVTELIDLEVPVEQARTVRESKQADWDRQLAARESTEVREIRAEATKLARSYFQQQMKEVEVRLATETHPSPIGSNGRQTTASEGQAPAPRPTSGHNTPLAANGFRSDSTAQCVSRS